MQNNEYHHHRGKLDKLKTLTRNPHVGNVSLHVGKFAIFEGISVLIGVCFS